MLPLIAPETVVVARQTSFEQDMRSLNERIESVHTDVKNPIIMKRFW